MLKNLHQPTVLQNHLAQCLFYSQVLNSSHNLLCILLSHHHKGENVNWGLNLMRGWACDLRREGQVLNFA